MTDIEKEKHNSASAGCDESSPCPDSATLSAYFDGGRDFDEATLEHISSCRKCAKVLSSLAIIGEAVSKSADEACTNDVTCRILEGTHKALKRDEKISCERRKAWTIRAIIFFVLLAIFIFLAVRDASLRRTESKAKGNVETYSVHSSPSDAAINSADENGTDRK